MKERLKFIVIFNIVATIIFFIGMFAAFYRVRDAIMWYSVNKTLLASNAATVKYPTGYDVLIALNEYRRSQGLPDFVLYEPLCNNIGARWQNYKNTNSHQGLDEFANKYMPKGRVGEILVSGKTTDEMISKWKSSPSHDLAIKNNSKACIYSYNGLSVGLLSN